MSFRVSLDGAADAAENMRRDTDMLQRYACDGVPSVRIYSWRAPCFTYGRNQDPNEVFFLDAMRRDGVSCAQRSTGGQVLCHGLDLSYAVVASCGDLGCGYSVKESYRRICGVLIDVYRSLGIDADFACDAGIDAHRDDAFCLAGREPLDITVRGKKIGGNAQRRVKDVILQHGSIPFSFDAAWVRSYVRDVAPDTYERIAVLGDLVPDVSHEELTKRLGEHFSAL
jgi:lipoate-protein ligase A